jgi:DNA-binding PadR family transcriptional regulator
MVSLAGCSCSGKNLMRLIQPAVMAVLARKGSALHGYFVVQRLQELAAFHDDPPDPAGVYKVLKSLERAKLVASAWDLSVAGRPKRKFKLTARGSACLKQWVATLVSYRESIDQILGFVGKSCAARSRS